MSVTSEPKAKSNRREVPDQGFTAALPEQELDRLLVDPRTVVFSVLLSSAGRTGTMDRD